MSDELKPHVSILELREAMEIGRDRERERIIKLLEDNAFGDYKQVMLTPKLISLIKGGQNG